MNKLRKLAKKQIWQRLNMNIDTMQVNEAVRKIRDDQLRLILEKPEEERTNSDIKTISNWLKCINFFKERNLKDTDLGEMIPHLKWQSENEPRTLFKVGDPGEVFYMVASG